MTSSTERKDDSRHLPSRWRELLPDQERAQFERASFGKKIVPGLAPAVVVIDMTRMMFDPAFSLAPSGGAEATVRGCADLVSLGRARGWPIFWTLRSERRLPAQRGSTDWKWDSSGLGPGADDFVAPLVPEKHDLLIGKPSQSGFFETPLRSQLTWLGVDTLMVCGMSTSGCVRATVFDAFASNFRTFVVEDAVGDRSPFAHAANLLDMDMKNASVVSLEAVEKMYPLDAAV